MERMPWSQISRIQPLTWQVLRSWDAWVWLELKSLRHAICKAPTKIILLTLHNEIYLYQAARTKPSPDIFLKDLALDDLSNAITTCYLANNFLRSKLFKDMNYQSVLKSLITILTPSGNQNSKIDFSKDYRLKEDRLAKLFTRNGTIEKHRSKYWLQKITAGEKNTKFT